MTELPYKDLELALSIAKSIIEAWKHDRTHPDHNFNDSTCEPWVSVRRGPGDCSSFRDIRAQRGARIILYLPQDGRDTAPANYWEDAVRVVAAVIVHEFIHDTQAKADPKAAEAIARVERGILTAYPDLDKAPEEELGTYYSERLEIEAHAAQVATEMHFGAARIEDTHVWHRIAPRLRRIKDPELVEAYRRAVGSYSQSFMLQGAGAFSGGEA